MKKLFSAIMIVAAFAGSASAQEAKAKAILAEVSKKYKSQDAIKADFSFTLDNQAAKVKESQEGTLYVKANSNKYKVVMTNQELFSDGKSQWTYLKKDREIQVSNVDNSGEALNPAKIFTLYEKGFKYTYIGDGTEGGKTVSLIELVPVDASKSIFKVRLGIDKALKQIVSAKLFAKNGNTYTYKVKTNYPNARVPESTFSLDPKKYPGVELVDLR